MTKTMADVGREGLNRSSLNRSKSAILFGGNMWNKIQVEKLRNSIYWKKLKAIWYNARYRCNNPIRYKRWAGRGIKCKISFEEVVYLWYRDKGYLMRIPSIDRINNDGDYELKNCRFIELADNVRRALMGNSHTLGRFHSRKVSKEFIEKRIKKEGDRCIHGHLFTPENSYWNEKGWRICRACRREDSRKRRLRLREQLGYKVL